MIERNLDFKDIVNRYQIQKSTDLTRITVVNDPESFAVLNLNIAELEQLIKDLILVAPKKVLEETLEELKTVIASIEMDKSIGNPYPELWDEGCQG